MWIDIIMKDGTTFTMDVHEIINDSSRICLNGPDRQQCIVDLNNVEWIDGTVDDSPDEAITATLEKIFNCRYEDKD